MRRKKKSDKKLKLEIHKDGFVINAETKLLDSDATIAVIANTVKILENKLEKNELLLQKLLLLDPNLPEKEKIELIENLKTKLEEKKK